MGPRLTLLDAPGGAEESCYIDGAIGIAAVLRAVAAAGSRAAAYIDGGTSLVHTTLLGVDENARSFFFEPGPDVQLNARLLGSEKVVFVTSDQGVPVQFSCPSPVPARYEEMDVFKAALPARVLRLQRRGYYRLPGESGQELVKCRLVVEQASAGPVTLQPEVLDLSCGGVGAGVAAGSPVLDGETRLECRIELTGVCTMQVPAAVRTVHEIMLPSGLEGRRYGIEFLSLPDKSATALQRFILEQQRVRKKLRL